MGGACGWGPVEGPRLVQGNELDPVPLAMIPALKGEGHGLGSALVRAGAGWWEPQGLDRVPGFG